MKETPKRPGRPPEPDAEHERLEIRLSEARKQAYSDAAARAGLAVGAWIKRVLDRASKRR